MKKQTRAWFSCRANIDVFSSHTPAKVSTCSSEEPNPPWITGRLGLDYTASENPSQRAAIISIRVDSGPHLLPHSRLEGDSSGPIQDILKEQNKKKLSRIYKMKFCCFNLSYLLYKGQFPFKAPYVKCVLNFMALLHTLAKDVSKSTWMCVWPRRFFIVPVSTYNQPCVQ